MILVRQDHGVSDLHGPEENGAGPGMAGQSVVIIETATDKVIESFSVDAAGVPTR